ncbi:MAG: hypothetical protein BWY83_00258 [bacterium ADurb.Bin478]|nr:MAG: hypothetical protein BWY83_00258 [bacterium ADurb.Bin478]
MDFFALAGPILALVLAALLLLAALTLWVVRWMGKKFRAMSGWDNLAQAFPGPVETPAGTRSGPVKVGAVYFRYGARFCPTDQGFFLVFHSVYHYPPLLIPWQALQNPRPAILFWRSARCLEVGNPTITTLTVLEDTWRWMEPLHQAIKN